MFKFIHAAEIHLDSPLHRLDIYEGAPVQQIRQASRTAFEKLVNLAIEHSRPDEWRKIRILDNRPAFLIFFLKAHNPLTAVHLSSVRIFD